jgi:hypothetical protein
MAVEYIKIDTTATGGQKASELQNIVNTVEAAQERLPTIKSQMDKMIDGTDYTAIETYYKLPTGTGQTVYNLVAGAVTDIASNNLLQLVQRLG